MSRLRWLMPACALLAAACQGPLPTSAPANGGTLTIALSRDPATLNRFVASDTVSQRAVAPLFPMLYSLAPDMSVVPDLAVGSPTLSDGGKTLTVHIRRNARWSDGKLITADDVVSTVGIERDRNLVTGVIFDWDKLDKVDKVDDYTIRFSLTEVYAPFLANSLVTFVAPAHVYGLVDPAHMKDDPIGIQPTVTGGPYKFDKRIAGQEIDLVVNPDYYGGRGHFDRIVEKVIPDPATAANSLLTGEVGWQPDAPYTEVKKLKGSATYVRTYPDMGYYDVRFNDRPDRLFGDRLVRQAFAYSIDKEALVKDVTGGAGTPMWGDILPTSWAFDRSSQVRYKQDLDRARSLLGQAGWVPGNDGILTRAGRRFSASFYVRGDSAVRNAAAQEIAQKVRAVGMDLTVVPTDINTFFDPLKAGKFDIALSGFATGPDPDDYYVFDSSQLRPEKNPAGVNWSGYLNPELDRAIATERSTLLADPVRTRAERKKAFNQVERILSGDVVTYFLWSDNTVQGFDVNVVGVQNGTLVNVDYDRNSAQFAVWSYRKH
ncbi:MAG: ABC transporter substrate-binding protein [Candidatus Dormibacteria bacterium]